MCLLSWVYESLNQLFKLCIIINRVVYTTTLNFNIITHDDPRHNLLCNYLQVKKNSIDTDIFSFMHEALFLPWLHKVLILRPARAFIRHITWHKKIKKWSFIHKTGSVMWHEITFKHNKRRYHCNITLSHNSERLNITPRPETNAQRTYNLYFSVRTPFFEFINHK